MSLKVAPHSGLARHGEPPRSEEAAIGAKRNAETRDRTGDLQIFSLTLSQLSYRGLPDVENLKHT